MKILSAFLVFTTVLVCGCGSGSSPANVVPPPIAVTISPSSATLDQLDTQQFTVSVSGTTNASVTWAVKETANSGSVQNGLYTAPGAAGTLHVTVTSNADPTKSATAEVVVRSVSLSLSTNDVPLDITGTFQFSATVSGSKDKAVMWSVHEGPLGGAVSATGLYTPGNSSGDFHVTATSQADSTKADSATVHVHSGIVVQIGTRSVTIDQGGSAQFSATVGFTTNQGVTWTVVEGSSGGSITADGLYTAPKIEGVFHVVATSIADITKNDQASITARAVSVNLKPGSANVQVGHSRSFEASIVGTADEGVTWSIDEGAAGGNIDDQGIYTAPAATGTFTVRARSIADPSKSGTATVRAVANGFVLGPVSGVSGGWEVTATRLANGNVLVAGGRSVYGDPSRTAEVLDHASGRFDSTWYMNAARYGHTATLLPDGRVLIVGGWDYDDYAFPGDEIYDPITRTFTSLGTLDPVTEHAAIALPNGKVLVTGGDDYANWAPVRFAYEFDPVTNTSAYIGDMNNDRTGHTMVLLGNGKVLICGGWAWSSALASVEIYDPATHTFTKMGPMNSERWRHQATLLTNGKVLITGGMSSGSYLSSAEIFDPGTGQFTPVGSMKSVHMGHTASLLPDGRVLIAGGYDGNSPSVVSELFDPTTETFSYTGDLEFGRNDHRAVVMPDGSVLIVGGGPSEVFR